MKKVDLHTHSFYSDGTSSPRHVVENAGKSGVSLLFLTDHDTLEGSQEALARGKELDLEVHCGIEINTADLGQVHILGYGFDFKNAVLAERLAEFRKRREKRVERIVENLNRCGVALSFEEVRAVSRQSLGRPHVADALKNKGVVKSRQEAFDRFLIRGKPGYAEPMGPSPEEAIALIREVGGFSSLAHPHVVKDISRLKEWARMGLEGIEVYYAGTKASVRSRFKSMADEIGLISTGGSDFHGPGSGRDGDLGVEIPDDVYGRFAERLSRCS